MTDTTYQQFRGNHKLFCCPYGHEQFYCVKSDKEKLAEEERRAEILAGQLKASQDSRDYYREQSENHKNALRSTKGVVTKMKKRSSGGTCQCCNRYFKNVRDHYKTKHPNYDKE
jgi:hypothetical protein